jgi:glutamate synthase domain-containing protein 2
VGRESEVVAICKAMLATGIKPDFITVDGGEGGTGAAPLEFSNSVGMPLREGLAFVCDCLSGFNLKNDIRVIAVGKIFTAFHMVKNLALGADMCYSARGFMLSLGCVQSLICNTNHCPTGVATQDPSLTQGLVVTDKAERVMRFHAETLERLAEIVAAAGLRSSQEFNRTHVYRRVSQQTVKRYDELFAYADVGCLLEEPYPMRFEQQMAESQATTFMPGSYIARHVDGLRELDMSTNR